MTPAYSFRSPEFIGLLSRASSTTPVVTMPPPEAWWKADTIVSTDGTALATWPDSTVNGHDMTQVTAGIRPVYKTNRANSLPAVNFGTINANSYFDIPRFFPAYTSAEIFMVLRSDDSPNPNGTRQGLMNMGAAAASDFYPDTVNRVFPSFGASVNQAGFCLLSTRNWRILNISAAASSYFIRLNGTQLSFSGINTVTWPAVGHSWLGRTESNLYFYGDVAEFMFYPSVLSSSDRSLVHAYLTAKYLPAVTAPATTNLVSHWKADAIVASDGDSLAQWNDSVGTNHLTQASSSIRPKYKTNRTLNGKPAVNFGTLVANSYFSVPYFFSLYSSAEAFIVTKVVTDPNSNLVQTGVWTLCGSPLQGAAFGYTGIMYDNFGFAGNKLPTNVSRPNLATDFRYYNVYSATNDWQSRLNGWYIFNSTSGGASWQSEAYLGRSRAGGSDYYTYGDVAELLFYSAKLSAADRATTELYLEQKYGMIPFIPTASGNFSLDAASPTVAWYAMTVAPNGNVYACVFGGDIYMQTGGTGAYTSLAQGNQQWAGLAAAPNGNVYATTYTGNVYMQTGGTGNFVFLQTIGAQLYKLCAASNGNVYATVRGGTIYMQTNGTGSFVSLAQPVREWTGLCASPSGNIYAAVSLGDIYMQTGGTGNFVALGQTSRNWQGMACATNGNVYAVTFSGGDIYMQSSGIGNFAALSQTARDWIGCAAAPNGSIYASEYGGRIYKRSA